MNAKIKNKNGQALIEWIVFGSAFFILWISLWFAAQYIFQKTLTTSYAVLWARRDLSGLQGHNSNLRQGKAFVRLGHAQTYVSLQLPDPKQETKGWLHSLWSSFGSQFLPY